jgi:hypothetical protein
MNSLKINNCFIKPKLSPFFHTLQVGYGDFNSEINGDGYGGGVGGVWGDGYGDGSETLSASDALYGDGSMHTECDDFSYGDIMASQDGDGYGAGHEDPTFLPALLIMNM